MKTIITNQPPKGTYDWLPEEFNIRKYIFDTFRSVCEDFGYQEYLTPLLEYADLYRAKSGEDVGGKELTIITDRGGRELAIRPEMTPSVTRMVSKIYQNTPKPIRLFSIANFYRNEAPQRGRNREFWQLNFDIFGSNSIYADIEIIQIGIEIMRKFRADATMFEVKLNNRKIVQEVLDKVTIDKDLQIKIVRILDKYIKLTEVDFIKLLQNIGLDMENIVLLQKFMNCKTIEDIKIILVNSENITEFEVCISTLEDMGYSDFLTIDCSVIRGFDYYDGTIFEFFDKNPINRKAMFGGGRYNGLAQIFDMDAFPAVGMAPGDETMKLFLESWNLLKENETKSKPRLYFPRLIDNAKTYETVRVLLSQKYTVTQGLDIERISGKLFTDAAKLGFTFICLLGENEILSQKYTIKNIEDRSVLDYNI